jgi:hypothetical protein
LFAGLSSAEALMRTDRLLLVVVLALLCTQAFAQTAARRIRGDVASIEGQRLDLVTRSGEKVTIELDDKYSVTAVVPVDVATIKPGTYVGTATMPQPDGTQRALEVLVLPEAARGSGEGHYPWDLQPGSMMTNATVEQIVSVDPGHRMTLKYKGGEQTVAMPAGIPVVTLEPGDRSMLKTGAHVFVSATIRADGALTASRVTVGKDGLVPPM